MIDAVWPYHILNSDQGNVHGSSCRSQQNTKGARKTKRVLSEQRCANRTEAKTWPNTVTPLQINMIKSI